MAGGAAAAISRQVIRRITVALSQFTQKKPEVRSQESESLAILASDS